MLSDDVYKTQLRTTAAELEFWLATLRNVAAIDTARDEASWRVSALPHVPEACPFELMLRADQHYDVTVAHETYEDQPIDGLDAFQPLLAAITDGRIVTRMWSTAATATLMRIETIVSPPGGHVWTRSRQLVPAHRFDADSIIIRDHHYAPYARGA
jgi:hypothetical protein